MKPIKLNLDAEVLNKWISKAKLDKVKWKSPKMIGSALAAMLVLGGGTYLYVNNVATYVVVNGETVGIVESTQSGKALIENILEEKGTQLGTQAITYDEISYKRAYVSGNNVTLLTREDLEEDLSIYAKGVELRIEDQPLLALPSQEEADRLLKSYQELYAQKSETNAITSVSFEEDVETAAQEVPIKTITTFDQAIEKLKEGNTEKVEYEIQEGDSWWLIARKNNLLTAEVLAANPGYTLDTFPKPGEEIMIEKVSPYITVVCEGVKTDKEVIPFDVVTKTDAKLASGQSKVTQQGSDGEKEVKYSYVTKNDKVIEKAVVDEKVTKKAVEQVIAKGPKKTQVMVAYSRGSAKISGLTRPYGGGISSYYGSRHGEFHTGVDLSGSTGDPYVAAGSGKVISAGWSGGYGKCIVVDHGNGIKTRYAHSSKILVSVGDSVSRGQTIGLVGSTGRSTGPHLHFEIIVNGDTVNPLNYI